MEKVRKSHVDGYTASDLEYALRRLDPRGTIELRGDVEVNQADGEYLPQDSVALHLFDCRMSQETETVDPRSRLINSRFDIIVVKGAQGTVVSPLFSAEDVIERLSSHGKESAELLHVAWLDGRKSFEDAMWDYENDAAEGWKGVSVQVTDLQPIGRERLLIRVRQPDSTRVGGGRPLK